MMTRIHRPGVRPKSAPALPRYRENDLFRRGPQVDLNACVGRNGGPYDLEAYSRGYFHAAERLMASLEENTTNVDVILYPLVYLYRHGVELALKALAQKLPRIWDDHGEIHLTHKLQDNWARVRPYLTREPEFDPNEPVLKFVDRVLADLIEIDPKGEAFRFPSARDGKLFLQDMSIINLQVFGEAMNTVAEAFDYWYWRTTELWDAKCEMEAEAYS
jgi:hypothetical protein